MMGNHAERYKPHPHRAVSVNGLREHEQKVAGFNQRIAILITNALGSVPCMYFFMILALIGFPGLHASPYQYVQWLSQTCIQLVALSVLGISQNILNHHTELQSDAMYDTDIKTFHDAEVLIKQGNALHEEIDVLKEEITFLKNTLVTISSEQLKHTDLLTQAQKPVAPRRRPMKQPEERE